MQENAQHTAADIYAAIKKYDWPEDKAIEVIAEEILYFAKASMAEKATVPSA